MDDTVFKDLMEGLKQAAAHARGEPVPAIHRRLAGPLPAQHRHRVSTLRNRGQGRRRPEGPARVLLALLDRNPRAVQELLGEAA